VSRRRSKQNFLVALALAGIALASPEISIAIDPPLWLREAARSPVPTLDRNVPALVLLNDQRVTVDEEGRVLTATSYAVRVLTRAGRAAAEAGEVYRTDTGKVRDLHAWLIPSAGAAREYSKDDIADVALVDNDVYNEARVKRIETALRQFPSLTLAGSAYHGVGISDCVRTGEEAAQAVVGHFVTNSMPHSA